MKSFTITSEQITDQVQRSCNWNELHAAGIVNAINNKITDNDITEKLLNGHDFFVVANPTDTKTNSWEEYIVAGGFIEDDDIRIDLAPAEHLDEDYLKFLKALRDALIHHYPVKVSRHDWGYKELLKQVVCYQKTALVELWIDSEHYLLPMSLCQVPNENGFYDHKSDDYLSGYQDEILKATIESGYNVADTIFAKFELVKAEVGEFGRIEAGAYWEFIGINNDLSEFVTQNDMLRGEISE